MGPKTYDLLEDVVQDLLIEAKDIDSTTDEGKDVLNKTVQLTNLLITADKDSYDYHDKEERRRIEEERNKAADATERDKQKVTWQRVGLEMAKVVVPMGLSIVAYFAAQTRILKFEETGRLTSSAGRELHLPKFMKW